MKSKKTPLAEYLDDCQIGHLQTMSLEEYKYHLECEHFLFVDSHDFLVDGFVGRTYAASRDQLDLLIKHLQKLRYKMDKHPTRYL